LKEVTKEVQASLKEITDKLFPREGVQGIYRDPNLVTSKLRGVRSITYEIDPLNTTQQITIEQIEKLIEETMEKQWKRSIPSLKQIGRSIRKQLKRLRSHFLKSINL